MEVVDAVLRLVSAPLNGRCPAVAGVGWLVSGLFCGSCVGCVWACGMFRAGLQSAHIFNKAISRCRRLLLAER